MGKIEDYMFVVSVDGVLAVCQPKEECKLEDRIEIKEPYGSIRKYVRATNAVYDFKNELLIFSDGKSQVAVKFSRFIDVINTLRIMYELTPYPHSVTSVKEILKGYSVYLAEGSTLDNPRLVFVFPEDGIIFGVVAPRCITGEE